MGGIKKRLRPTSKITDQQAGGGQVTATKDMPAESAPPPAATDQSATGADGQQTPPQEDSPN